MSLCQSGNAARNMAPAVRIPSRSAVTPIGGSWLTKSSARYSSTAPRSPLVNRASMNEVTVFLFCLIVSMTAVCGRATSEGTPTIWGLPPSRHRPAMRFPAIASSWPAPVFGGSSQVASGQTLATAAVLLVTSSRANAFSRCLRTV
jgi:hypothetical protein